MLSEVVQRRSTVATPACLSRWNALKLFARAGGCHDDIVWAITPSRPLAISFAHAARLDVFGFDIQFNSRHGAVEEIRP
jgi:hypothetical protein